jgi:hypothetical protein
VNSCLGQFFIGMESRTRKGIQKKCLENGTGVNCP